MIYFQNRPNIHKRPAGKVDKEDDPLPEFSGSMKKQNPEFGKSKVKNTRQPDPWRFPDEMKTSFPAESEAVKSRDWNDLEVEGNSAVSVFYIMFS